MHANEIWEGNRPSHRLLRAALVPASLLYAGGWQAYLAAYRFGLKRAREPHAPVICIGNLMVGGTGKSPLTVHLAELIGRLGRRVVISASGYGSPAAEAARLSPPGPLAASEWGDEPSMLRWQLPETPIIVGRRRVLAAEIAHREFPDAVLLMDDGFQHLPLKKHLSIVLDPADPPNRWCLPAGPYREPRANRRRADLVVPGRFEVVADPLRFESPEGQTVEIRDYSVLCALGQPDRFLAALPKPPLASRLLPDHDPLTAGTLFDGLPKDIPTVVTAKDWVKLRERPDIGRQDIVIARHSVRVEPADEFASWLKDKLDGTPDR